MTSSSKLLSNKLVMMTVCAKFVSMLMSLKMKIACKTNKNKAKMKMKKNKNNLTLNHCIKQLPKKPRLVNSLETQLLL